MLLVTGITGHTGRYFLQELINNNYEGAIRCVVRETSDTSLIDNSGLNIEKVTGDLNDSLFIEKMMKDIDVIIHIYNIHHSPQIVQSAIKNKVKRAILVHTTGVYSQFKKASYEYKLLEDQISKLLKNPMYPTTVTILRPSMIYGDLCDSNMSKFIKMIDKNKIMPVIDKGTSLIQPVNARDLGKAFYTVLMSPKNTSGIHYDLTGKEAISMIDVFKIISKELNKNIIFINVPLSIGVFGAKFIKILTLGKIDYVERVQRMSEDRSYSHDKAQKDFGFDPMPFTKGIQIEVQEYLNKIN